MSNLGSRRFTLRFSSKFLRVLAFLFWSLINLGIRCEGELQLNSSACGYSFVSNHLLRRLFFIELFWHPHSASLTKNVRVYSGISIPLHWTIRLSLCHYHIILIIVDLWVLNQDTLQLYTSFSRLFWLFWISWFSILFYDHVNSAKKPSGILIGIVLIL